MFVGGGLFGLLVLGLFIYCLIDVISTDESLVRNLPKLVWVLLVIVVPLIGSAAWLLLGRPEGAGYKPSDTSYHRRRPLGPDDSPEFLARLDPDRERLQRWEDDLARREEELKRREQGDD